MNVKQRMRDSFIEGVMDGMRLNEKIIFLSADFGAPALDLLRDQFRGRFFNCGIAEANMINLATGFALEGYTVFAYAIAPFISMRCYEQIRVNLAMLSQIKKLNVNLVGVGAGYSYDVSGPSHQALEDISIIRTLPNILLLSPSDGVSARQMAEKLPQMAGPKYVRLDGKALATIYDERTDINLKTGFIQLRPGDRVCLVGTGYMTHKALAVAEILARESISIGVIDLYNLKSPDATALSKAIQRYDCVISMEEGFIGKGGMDALLMNILNSCSGNIHFESVGIQDQYRFQVGKRDTMLRLNQADEQSIIERLKKWLIRPAGR